MSTLNASRATAANVGDHWQFDKRIPIALIITLVLQFGGAVWFAASISGRVTTLEAAAAQAAQQPERTAALEAQMRSLTDTTNRIERKLDNWLTSAAATKR